MILTPAQIELWDRDGWLHLPGALAPSEVAELDDALHDLVAWSLMGGPGLHHFEQTDDGPVIARSELFADEHVSLGTFVRGPLLKGVVSQLLGEPAVLYKEKVNYKLPGGGGFAPHQDAAAYRFVDHHISVMVPVDDATEASGCLYFAPGYTAGRLRTDERGRITEEVAAALDWRPVEASAGDLVLFDSYAPHHSGPNTTDRPRRALYLTYNAASAGDLRAAYYADKQAELAERGATFDGERVRISISDDFLGRPAEPATVRLGQGKGGR